MYGPLEFLLNTVPTPNVTMTASDNNPVIGKSFKMKCNVVVARGISNVDIMWIVKNTVKRNQSVNYAERGTNLRYVDVYTITELQLSDNNTVYYCKAVVNANTNGISSTTINNVIIGKYITTLITYIGTYVYTYMHTFLAEYFIISMHTWLPVFQAYLHCHGLMGEPRKSC